MTRPPACSCTNAWCLTGVRSTLLSQWGPLMKHKASSYQHQSTAPAIVRPQAVNCGSRTEKGGSPSPTLRPWIRLAPEQREGESCSCLGCGMEGAGHSWLDRWEQSTAWLLSREAVELCPLLPGTLCRAHPGCWAPFRGCDACRGAKVPLAGSPSRVPCKGHGAAASATPLLYCACGSLVPAALIKQDVPISRVSSVTCRDSDMMVALAVRASSSSSGDAVSCPRSPPFPLFGRALSLFLLPPHVVYPPGKGPAARMVMGRRECV